MLLAQKSKYRFVRPAMLERSTANVAFCSVQLSVAISKCCPPLCGLLPETTFTVPAPALTKL